MQCGRCSGSMVQLNTSVINKSESRSFLWNFVMICITGGLWLLWMLVRKRSEREVRVTTATCQSCGSSWNV